jgi:2'-5' RNA ligase
VDVYKMNSRPKAGTVHTEPPRWSGRTRLKVAMSEQGLFGGFEASEVKTDRLLFLVYPDPETAIRIAALATRLRTEHGLRGRPVTAERLHITLRHLGDYAGVPGDVVRQAREAARVAVTAPFEVTFDRVGSFAGRARNLPFVLRGDDDLDELKSFNRALASSMERSGGRLAKWAKGAFTPHVTLLYDGMSVAEQRVEPITWTVSEFVLAHSLLGQTRHIILDRWLLRG